MKDKILVTIAIAMALLVASLPAVQAVTITVAYTGGTLTTSIPELADRTITFSHAGLGKYEVRVQVSNSLETDTISQVVIYKCKASDPASCISNTPDTFSGNTDKTYKWDDIADQTSSYPQKANLMILVKTSNSKGSSWSGYWHVLTRTGLSTFFNTETDIDSVTVNAKSISYATPIKTFIQERRMIPLNQDWTSSVKFSSSSTLYEITSSTFPSTLSSQTLSSSSLSGISSKQSIVFPKTSTTYNGIGLNENPSYSCGNGEIELGETSATCCYDVGCTSGKYCDTGGTTEGVCKLLPALRVPTGQSLGVKSCNTDSTLQIELKIDNSPQSTTIKESGYTLEGVYRPMECEKQTTSYLCTLTIPEDPDCQEGEHTISGGELEFKIEYFDGPTKKSQTVKTALPAITVGSWICGDNICDTEIGETQSNCCYDCGCQTGKYCDYLTDPQAATCMSKITDLNLKIDSESTNFYTHNTGDYVTVSAEVTNAPSSLQVTSSSCSIDCLLEDSACSASCDASCSQYTNNPFVQTCRYEFSIDPYDPTKEYQLVPSLTLGVQYKDGTNQPIAQELTQDFNTINIGSKWCGDNVCQPDETNCCYDCNCGFGQYCDTEFSTPSPQDTCKSDALSLITTPSQTMFDTQLDTNTFTVDVEVQNSPSRVALDHALCDIGPNCIIECEEVSQKPYKTSCTVTLPPDDYKTSEFYDTTTRQLVYPASITLDLSYQNGPFPTTKALTQTLPNIRVDVNSECGNGFCDSQLDETSGNCCVDCGCSESEFCATFSSLAGTCVSSSSFTMEAASINLNPVRCEIPVRGDCQFGEDPIVKIRFTNPPDDLRIESSSYSLSGLECAEGETICDVTCLQSADPDSGEIIPGEYQCYPGMPQISNRNPGTSNTDLEITLATSYTIAGESVGQNFTATKQISIKRATSSQLKSCQEEEEDYESQLSSMKSLKSTVMGVVIVLAAVVTGVCIACAFGCESCCAWCEVGVEFVLPCAGSILFPIMGYAEGKITELGTKKAGVCAAEGYGDLESASMDMGGVWYDAVGAGLGVICLVSAMNGGGWSGIAGGEGSPVIAKPIGGGKYPSAGSTTIPTGATTGVQTGSSLRTIGAGAVISNAPSVLTQTVGPQSEPAEARTTEHNTQIPEASDIPDYR